MTEQRTLAADLRPARRAADAAARTLRGVGCRTRAAVAVLATATLVEGLTPLPGLRLALAVGVVAGPALAFAAFWRALAWLRAGKLDPALAARHRPDWRGRRLLWTAFGVLWAVDAAAAVAFFRVASLVELNPVTVVLHGVVGLPGVVLAAACYAGLVVAAVRALPDPKDFDVLLCVTLAYATVVLHNAVLLLGG